MGKNFVKKEITQEVISTFLEGYDPQERIVNLEYSYSDDYIKVYYRDENDNKHISKEPFYPFLWATKKACVSLCDGDREKVKSLLLKYGIWVKQLDTTNVEGVSVKEVEDGYTYLFRSTLPMSYQKFLNFFKEAGLPVYSRKKDEESNSSTRKKLFLVVTPQEQFLISTGKRFFKGYDDYDQTLRLIFDLETTGLDTKKDRIEQFGIRFNRQVKYKGEYMTFEKIYSTDGNTKEEKDASELNNIDKFLRILHTFKPDIITAHNGENFDWNVIIGACERLGTSLEEMSEKYFDGESIKKDKRESILKLGGEIEKYRKTIVPRTIITDSLHAVRRAQALDSNMLESGLKYVSKYSKIVKNDRTYIPGDRISDVWNSNLQYAYNDLDGDWYIYDENYKQELIKPDPLKDIDFFKRKIEEKISLMNFSGKTENECDNSSAEELYENYISSINEENEKAKYKKGKDNKKFVLYTKNFIMDGYKIVDGKYIAQRYLLDDLWECDKVEHRYNTSNFLICKMLPVPFQKCCTMGTAGQWKALMLAWSYENNLAIPSFGESKTFTGGLSRLLKVGFVDNVAKFDYNSLYPSIILTWAISDNKDLMNSMLAFLEHVLTQREKYKKLKKAASKKADSIKEILQNHEYSTKEEGKKLNQEMLKWKSEEAFNDKKQLPLKIFGNSFFGSYGAPQVFPWASIDCAERTTCTGRMALRLMISWFNNIGYSPIVGDSFTYDTPLFIKYKNSGLIDIKPICELIDESEIKIDELGREYDYSKKDYNVLCRSGWIEPSYIYRHKTDKDIYEVSENEMSIEVTEDHSLFNSDREKISPKDITSDTKLEYYNNKINSEKTTDISNEEIIAYAKELSKGHKDRISINILNTSTDKMKLFYNTFMENYSENLNFSKTCIAGLKYLKNTFSKNN